MRHLLAKAAAVSWPTAAAFMALQYIEWLPHVGAALLAAGAALLPAVRSKRIRTDTALAASFFPFGMGVVLLALAALFLAAGLVQ